MLFFTAKPSQFVGVDIGAGGIKVIEMRNQSNRPYLYTYGFTDEPVPFRALKTLEEKSGQVGATAEILKAVLLAAKTSSTAAVASLPQKDIFSTVLTIPEVDQKLFANTVAREVEKLLPFPLAEAVLDTRKLPAGTAAAGQAKTTRVFVVAARRATIQMYTDIFAKAGLSLQSIETETFATTRALLGNDPAPAVIVDLGKKYTSCSYIDHGIPVAELSMEFGGDKLNEILAPAWKVTPAEAEQMKIEMFTGGNEGNEEQLLALLQPFYEPLLKDIAGLFNSLQRASIGVLSRPDKIVLTGGASHCPGLEKTIEQHFSVKTYSGDPWARVMYPPALKPVLDKVASRLSVAIGLAERSILN